MLTKARPSRTEFRARTRVELHAERGYFAGVVSALFQSCGHTPRVREVSDGLPRQNAFECKSMTSGSAVRNKLCFSPSRAANRRIIVHSLGINTWYVFIEFPTVSFAVQIAVGLIRSYLNHSTKRLSFLLLEGDSDVQLENLGNIPQWNLRILHGVVRVPGDLHRLAAHIARAYSAKGLVVVDEERYYSDL